MNEIRHDVRSFGQRLSDFLTEILAGWQRLPYRRPLVAALLLFAAAQTFDQFRHQ
jgi:hypothetical protein